MAAASEGWRCSTAGGACAERLGLSTGDA
jgi:hypothetical protein